MSQINNLILYCTRKGTRAIISCQLTLQIVGDYVRITSFLLLLYTQITSCNFLYRVLVAFPLILFISLKLKILLLQILLLYKTNLNTSFTIKVLISYFCKAQKSCLKVVIILRFLKLRDKFKLSCSFFIINTSKILISCYTAAINWLSVSLRSLRYTPQSQIKCLCIRILTTSLVVRRLTRSSSKLLFLSFCLLLSSNSSV